MSHRCATQVCAGCSASFRDPDDLLVLSVGRGGLVPVHPRCRKRYEQSLPWYLRATGVVNRPTAWIWLAGFNLIFAGWWWIASGDRDARIGIALAWTLANLLMVTQRLVAWKIFEAPLRRG